MIDCPICFLRFDKDLRRPEVINPCGHTMCKHCLSQINVTQNLCPICRHGIVSTIPNWSIVQSLPENQMSSSDEFNSIVSNVDEIQSVIINTFKKLHDEHTELTQKIEKIKEEFRSLDKKQLGFVDQNEIRNDQNKKNELKNQLSAYLVSLKQLEDKLTNTRKFPVQQQQQQQQQPMAQQVLPPHVIHANIMQECVQRSLDTRTKLYTIKDYSQVNGLESLTLDERKSLETDLLKVFSRELTRVIMNNSTSNNWPEELRNSSTRKDTIKRLQYQWYCFESDALVFHNVNQTVLSNQAPPCFMMFFKKPKWKEI